MKKNRKKTTARKSAQAPAPKPDQGRRDVLRLARNLAIATPVVLGAGILTVRSVSATICEADLTKIGNGKPAIVQIHDPNCRLCQTLQKQSRRALKAFDDEQFTFLVANINTPQGRDLAREHRVPHVTLLLFDARGQMVQVVRGPTDQDTLGAIFDAHLSAHS